MEQFYAVANDAAYIIFGVIFIIGGIFMRVDDVAEFKFVCINAVDRTCNAHDFFCVDSINYINKNHRTEMVCLVAAA